MVCGPCLWGQNAAVTGRTLATIVRGGTDFAWSPVSGFSRLIFPGLCGFGVGLTVHAAIRRRLLSPATFRVLESAGRPTRRAKMGF
jgi:hypothetical protein